MRVLSYAVAIVVAAGIAWQYPFLFELPLVVAIGGAYWAFFANKGSRPSSPADRIK